MQFTNGHINKIQSIVTFYFIYRISLELVVSQQDGISFIITFIYNFDVLPVCASNIKFVISVVYIFATYLSSNIVWFMNSWQPIFTFCLTLIPVVSTYSVLYYHYYRPTVNLSMFTYYIYINWHFSPLTNKLIYLKNS